MITAGLTETTVMTIDQPAGHVEEVAIPLLSMGFATMCAKCKTCCEMMLSYLAWCFHAYYHVENIPTRTDGKIANGNFASVAHVHHLV